MKKKYSSYSRKISLFFLKLKGLYEIVSSKIFKIKTSTMNVDVIITMHLKDLKKIKKCIHGLKKNLMHPIDKIYIISSSSLKAIKMIKELDCIFIDENTLIKLTKDKIQYKPGGIDRAGWLFQQFLNYAGIIALGRCEYKFCINADTILSRKQIFYKNNKIVFNATNDYQNDYFEIAEKLLGLKTFSKFSFTSHHMLYKRKIMKQMLNTIEKKFKEPWYLAILNNINKNLHSSHSDFDTYAQFFYNNYKKSMKIEYWFNKTVFKNTKINNFFNHFIYKSISIHSWAEDK